MARSLLLLIPLLLVGVCNAELPSERYWHKVMPNTPVPDAVRVFMFPDIDDEKATSVDVGKGGVHVDTGKAQPKGTSVDVGKGGVNVNTKGGTNVNVAPKGKPGVYVYTPPHKGQPVIVKVGKSPFDYRYAAEEDQIHDDPSVAYFFLEKDLHANKKINIQFMKTTPGATFLPRKSANAIPFSSTKYSEILTHFSLAPGSVEAITMKQTLKQCEEPAIHGEAKYCATSLESMVDFSTSKLGTTDVRVLTTKVDSKKSPKQIYTIAEAPIKVEATKSVACHSQSYAYAVFYCHETRATKAYLVPLVGEDGSKVEAVAVCHEDTSAWNPKHLAFQVLKIKPGTVPVCHFLPQDHLVWVPTSNKS